MLSKPPQRVIAIQSIQEYILKRQDEMRENRFVEIDNNYARCLEVTLPQFETLSTKSKNHDVENTQSQIKLKYGSISAKPETPLVGDKGKAIPDHVQSTLNSEKSIRFSIPIKSIFQEYLANQISESPGHKETKDVGKSEDNTRKNHSQSNDSSSHVKMRPVQYDGTEDWDEYLSQFEILSDINTWGDSEKGLYLASCLKGNARSILSELSQSERRDFSRLKHAVSRKKVWQ